MESFSRDGCGGIGQRRFQGRIENVRIFTMHERDGGGRVSIALKNARVRIMRSVDWGPDITIKQLYTDDQGFVTEAGRRMIEFDHCSINENKIQVYLSIELIDSPEKVRIKRSGAWYSWTRIETGRQAISYSSTRQTLNFGTAVGGNREIALDPNDAGRTFTWIKWSKQLLQQELGSAANFTSTLAIKIEDAGEGAHYSRFERNIHFATDRLFSERTAMHEFGHFAMHEMQRGSWQRGAGGKHYVERNNDHPGMTITEGFANGFAYIMDEMTRNVLDQESGRNEVGEIIHGLWRTQVYIRSDVPRPLDLNHPFVAEEIFARTLLDLWDGPNNYARFNNTTLDDYTDGGNDNFEMSLAELFRPVYTYLIPDLVLFHNSLLLENTGVNANRNSQMRNIWHFNFSESQYNVADFTILGTDEISGARVITHDRDDYKNWPSDTEEFDKVETYSYTYIGTDINVLNGAANSYNATTYVEEEYDGSGRLISSLTKNANGVTLSDPLRIINGATLGLHSGAQPRWYNGSSGSTRYTKRTEHLTIDLRAQARLTVGNESRITIGSAAPYQTTGVNLFDNTYIVVEDGATLTIAAGSTLNIWQNATLLVRNGGNVVVDGELMIRAGGSICIEQGGNVRLSASSRLYVDSGARMGVPAGLGLPTNLVCTNQVAACGRVEIFNSGVVNIGSRNEALQFDGGDVVSIPNTNSYVNELGQVFGVEAYIRADNLSAAGAQIIFSSWHYSSATRSYSGILFTLYGGQLLLQLNGVNYYSDATRLPNDNACHHVAVTRDHTNRIRFYIDGHDVGYAATSTYSAYTNGLLNLGADNVNGPYGEYFRGMIGELRVWNQWRSGEQIKQTFTHKLVAPQAGLVAYYDMQDNSGSRSLSDLSGVAQSGRNPVPGVLGASTTSSGDVPTWISNCALTCTVQGNFRVAPISWTAPDSTALPISKQPKPKDKSKSVAELSISPNPATASATLYFEHMQAGTVRVWVQDLMGAERALVLKETQLATGPQNLALPVQQLPPGLYLIMVQSSTEREYIRLEVR